jgi:hypothetical protein
MLKFEVPPSCLFFFCYELEVQMTNKGFATVPGNTFFPGEEFVDAIEETHIKPFLLQHKVEGFLTSMFGGKNVTFGIYKFHSFLTTVKFLGDYYGEFRSKNNYFVVPCIFLLYY